MSRIDLIKMFGNEDAETFNKCSKAYEKGRADAMKEKIIDTIAVICVFLLMVWAIIYSSGII